MSQGDVAGVVADTAGWDTVLGRLREDGFSPVDSIKVTRAVLGVPLSEAKRIVHMSDAWADLRGDFDDLHAAVGDIAAGLSTAS